MRGPGLAHVIFIRYSAAIMAYRRRKKRTSKRKDKEHVDPSSSSVSKGFIELHGVIEESLPAGTFKVKLDNGQTILAHLAGKMRMFRIRLLPGDEVKIEMTPYDLTKGRIVYRY